MAAFPDPELSNAFRPYLLSGERLLWTGRPKQGLMFQPADIFIVPFSFVWASGASTIFWTGHSAQDVAPFPFDLFGLFFVAIGLYFTVGRFLVDMAVRSRTIYAVTNRRVVALQNLAGTRLRTQDIRNLDGFELTERASGRGTIDFSAGRYEWWQNGGMSWTPALSRGLKFLGIANSRSVYEIIDREKAQPAS